MFFQLGELRGWEVSDVRFSCVFMAPLPLLRRTVELLTHSWDLSRRLRLPAISRLQKMHNVGLALQALRSRGVQLEDERGERRVRLSPAPGMVPALPRQAQALSPRLQETRSWPRTSWTDTERKPSPCCGRWRSPSRYCAAAAGRAFCPFVP